MSSTAFPARAPRALPSPRHAAPRRALALASVVLGAACGSDPIVSPNGPSPPDAAPTSTASSPAVPPPLACEPGRADCNGDPKDGCEVDTTRDPAHCGRCGAACEARADAEAACVASVCETRCARGFVACAAGCCAATGVIALGEQGSFATRANGTMAAWGYQGFFDGLVQAKDVWTRATTVPLLTEPLRHVAANKHRCAVTTAGRAVCWGRGSRSQLGSGGDTDSAVPVNVAGLGSGVRAISAGADHSCAVTNAGTVACWGNRLTGQYGAASPQGSARTPVPVTAVTGAVGVVSGGYHACAWTAAGEARCWGNNSYGQIGDGTNDAALTPVVVSGLAGVVLMSAGAQHTCALTKSGAVFCWGSGRAVGAATVDGSKTAVEIQGVAPARALAAGAGHTCAVTDTGVVRCWGENASGQLGDGGTTPSLAPVTVTGGVVALTIGAGDDHTCALTPAGGAKCWGNNWLGALGNGARAAQNAAHPTPSDVLDFP